MKILIAALVGFFCISSFASEVYCNGASTKKMIGIKLYPNGNKVNDNFREYLYPNGRRVKDPMKRVVYPNGKRIFSAHGSFLYPNGRKAVGFMSQINGPFGRKLSENNREVNFQLDRDLWVEMRMNLTKRVASSIKFIEEFSDHKLEYNVDIKSGKIFGIKCSNRLNKAIGSFL